MLDSELINLSFWNPQKTETYNISSLKDDGLIDGGNYPEIQELAEQALCFPPETDQGGWKQIANSSRTVVAEHDNYPGQLFKFCTKTPPVFRNYDPDSSSLSFRSGHAHNTAAHILRIPMACRLKAVIQEQDLDDLEVVSETAIPMVDVQEAASLKESKLPFAFVIKAPRINLMGPGETTRKLQSYPLDHQRKIAKQICELILRTGIADLHFGQLLFNKDTGKLIIIDTEPLYGALVMEPMEGLYPQSEKMLKRGHATRLRTVSLGLKKIYSTSKQVPGIQEVVKEYATAVGVSLDRAPTRSMLTSWKAQLVGVAALATGAYGLYPYGLADWDFSLA